MAKAYAELEKKLHGGDNNQAPPPAEPPKDGEQPTEGDVRDALDKAGVSFDALSEEFLQKGELSAESYEKLVNAGFPKELVDGYIEGQRAVAEGIQSSVRAEVGGAEQYDRMIAWAAVNLPDADKAAFNAAMNSGSVDQMKMAARDLASRYTKENGSEPRLVTGTAAKSDGSVYRSTAEALKDFADPRYKSDPAFRADVEAKIARSNVL